MEDLKESKRQEGLRYGWTDGITVTQHTFAPAAVKKSRKELVFVRDTSRLGLFLWCSLKCFDSAFAMSTFLGL